MPRRKRRFFSLRPRRAARGRTKATQAGSHHELLGLGLVALGLFLVAVMYFGWNGGYVGAAIARGLEALVGAAAFGLPIALLVVGALAVGRSELVNVKPFRTGLVILAVGIAVALGEDHGGYLGQLLGGGVGLALGATGSTILGVFLLVVAAVLLSGASVGALVRASHHAVAQGARRARPRQRETALARTAVVLPTRRTAPPIDAEERFPDVVGDPLPVDPPSLLTWPGESSEESLVSDDQPSQETLFLAERAPAPEYTLPDAGVLRSSKPAVGGSKEAAAHIADLLVETLAHFGVDANVVGQISGPRVTRYELQLAPGTKVAKVAALKDDLSYALATTEIRILAPIPGKQAVGVELPNLSPNIVTLGDIFAELPATASPVSVWLGKDIGGSPVWADLARMPHVLIAGTTGSGKSGCINAILTSILLRATPDEVRMILVDPKRVELSHYESIPHLLTPVVSSPKEASAVLANCCAEMERRYEQLASLRARNLPEANRALRRKGEKQLPYLMVVIDELADLMMVSPQAVEDAVIRLAQKSRAVGIHLVLATQRPSVDVITGMIKANVPSRIAFAVSSQTDSRVILDANGAESLLGQGDMLFKPLGSSRLQRLQGAYVSEEEIALVVEQTRQREPELDEGYLELPQVFADDADDAHGEFDPDDDPLLDKAIEIVLQTQTASVSLLQRRLRVGYTRAGRLIDMLERRGVISGYEGSKPRRVLIEDASVLTR